MTHDTLPSFGDRYLQVFNAEQKSLQVRRKSRSQGGIDFQECLELIGRLLRRYEMTYWRHDSNPNLLQMPFLFQAPSVGSRIRNCRTGEIYTVDQVILDPRGRFLGQLRLNLVNPPSYEHRESLELLEPEGYVRFIHDFAPTVPNDVGATTEGTSMVSSAMAPTVSWSLTRREPGALTGGPFSPNKEMKPRVRETVKDPNVPGYTVEIRGQWFDNIVQFDCWSNDSRTSGRLADWLDSFFRHYAWFLREQGLSQLMFWQRSRDSNNVAWRQAAAVHSLQYYLRTEQLEACYQRDLLKIDINLELLDAPGPDLTPRYIAGQEVSGTLTQQQYEDLFYRSGEYLFGEVNLLQ